jgi:uncharacterized protein YcfJ
MTTKIFRNLVLSVIGIGLSLGTLGCSTNAGNGALIGGAAGAGLGAIIGHNSHGRTASGAAIGGAAGAIGGALIGNEMDKKEARERDRYDDDRPTRRYRDDYYDRDRDRGGDGYYESRHYEDSNGRYYDSYRETRVYPR